MPQESLHLDCHSGLDPESSVSALDSRFRRNDGFETHLNSRPPTALDGIDPTEPCIPLLRHRRTLCISFILLFWAVVSNLSTYSLRVKEVPGGRELAAIHVSQGDLLSVEYVHSMYKVKQSEIFSIGRDSRFYLEKVTFGSYAAALYYDAEPLQGFTFEDGLWTVKGDGKSYPLLKYRVSPSTEHVLNVGNQRLELSANPLSPGGLIELCLEKEWKNSPSPH